MPQSRSDEGKAYRAKVNTSEWRDAQNAKRRARRAAKRSASNLSTNHSVKPPKVAPKSKPAPSEFCEAMIVRIYKAKVALLAGAGKSIKKATVARQMRNVELLYERLTGKKSTCSDFDFLADTGAVVALVNKHFRTPNSRNTQFQAIASVLAVLPEHREQYQFYSKLSATNRQAINKTAGDNKHTAREAKNFMKWPEIASAINKAKDPRARAIMGLYTRMPVRRVDDVSRIRLDVEEGSDLAAKFEFGEHNWLTFSGGLPKEIVYNVHKTAKTMGQIVVKVPTELAVVLAEYIKSAKLKGGDVLFGTMAGGVHKNFSTEVTDAFGPYLPKRVTVNMLRHSFIQHVLSSKLTVNQKKVVAREMGHSFTTQALYDRIMV